MSELTLLLLRFGFLLLLWMFVFAIVYALRSDLFGAPVRRLRRGQQEEQAFASAPAPTPAPAVAPAAPAPPIASASAGPARLLVITSGASAGTQLELDSAPITIGRSSDSTLVILDEYTSTQHAQLIPQGTQWLIQDLDSTNGTRVAGQKLNGSVILPLNVPVSIGKTTFELRA